MTYRKRAVALGILGGGGLLIASAIMFRPTGIVEWPIGWSPGGGLAFNAEPRLVPAYGTALGIPALLLMLGTGVFAAALHLAPGVLPSLATADRSRRWPRPNWLAFGLGTLALLILAEINGRLLHSAGWLQLPAAAQNALLFGGSVLAAWGLAGAPGSHGILCQWRPGPQTAGLALLTLAALLLRTWQLGTLIPQPVDELNFMLAAHQLRTTPQSALLEPVTGYLGMTRVFVYWQAVSVDVFGRTLAALRLPGALVGALTVPAVYLLGRALYDARTGWIAAALLTAYPPHIHYSRLALNNIADPLFGTLGLALLALGLRRQQPLAWALGGVCLGLTQYFYEGGRWLLPLLAAGWLAAVWLLRRHKLSGRGLALAAAGFALAALPYYTVLHARDFPASPRYDAVGYAQGDWAAILRESGARHAFAEHVADTFLLYHHTPEAVHFYGGQTPLLLIVAAPLVMAGLATCLARPRHPGSALLVLWITATALGSSLLTGYPNTARYVVAFPALMLLAAVGLRAGLAVMADGRALPRLHASLGLGSSHALMRLRVDSRGGGVYLRGVSAWGQRRWRREVFLPLDLGALLTALSVAAVAWLHAAYYTGPHSDLLNQQLRYQFAARDGADAMLRAAELPPGTIVHLISDPPYDARYAQDLINFLADDMLIISVPPHTITGDYLITLPNHANHAFFIAPDDVATLTLLSEHFIFGAPRITQHDVPLEKQYVLFYAPRRPT